MSHIPEEHEVETFSGAYVNVNRPDPDTIRLPDIAHALSNICRYGGHCKHFYSVAQHAVFCAERVKREGYGIKKQLAALHHDDAEAFLGDIPRPLKPLLGAAYKRLTDRMDVAIVRALELPFEIKDGSTGPYVPTFHEVKIKSADNDALFIEAKHLLPSRGKHWWDGAQGAEKWGLPPKKRRIVTPDYYIDYVLSPENACAMYLRVHAALTEGAS
jgi:hypothetical protein